ncbi:hypothetical protein KJ975_01895, partial [Myxococcota bacterium]|nr:hypothetical protein [Myxococcota bacterium]
DIEKLLIYEEIDFDFDFDFDLALRPPKFPGGYDVDPLVQKNENSIALPAGLSIYAYFLPRFLLFQGNFPDTGGFHA